MQNDYVQNGFWTLQGHTPLALPQGVTQMCTKFQNDGKDAAAKTVSTASEVILLAVRATNSVIHNCLFAILMPDLFK